MAQSPHWSSKAAYSLSTFLHINDLNTTVKQFIELWGYPMIIDYICEEYDLEPRDVVWNLIAGVAAFPILYGVFVLALAVLA